MPNAATERPPVLILGKGPTALGVLRVLARDGLDARSVDLTDDAIIRSRWYRPAERALRETADSTVLAAYLASLTMPRAVLLACTDPWTAAVAGLPAETRSRFPASISSRATVDTCLDKGSFRGLIERLGIPAPRSLPIAAPDDLALADDELLDHGFLKPTDSQAFNRRYGTKGAFVSSRAEAQRFVEDAAEAGIRLLLQEWIPGPPPRTVHLDGFVDRTGRVTAMVARRRQRMEPPRLAVSASNVTIALDEVDPAVRMARRLLAELDYRGIFNVEFKYDDRDGEFKIIEVNARPFIYIAHIAAAGVDLSWMSYLDAQELPVPTSTGYQIGRWGVYELPDAAAIVRALRTHHRTDGPVLRPWLTGDHLTFWPSDPAPAIVEFSRALRRRRSSPGRARSARAT